MVRKPKEKEREAVRGGGSDLSTANEIGLEEGAELVFCITFPAEKGNFRSTIERGQRHNLVRGKGGKTSRWERRMVC